MSKKIRRFCLVRTKQLAFLHRSMVYYAYGLCSSDKNANTGLYPFADAARTPHGDSNSLNWASRYMERTDAARTPHGDSNRISDGFFHTIYNDAARTPHGDSNDGFAVMVG